MAQDPDRNGRISLIKFGVEAQSVEILLSEEDLYSLSILFGSIDGKTISYETAIKNIIPVLTKNSDKIPASN